MRTGYIPAYLANKLKIHMSYRMNFFIESTATLVYGFVNIVFLWALFQKTNAIAGWTFWEALFLYGLGELNFGLFSIIFFDTVKLLPGYYIIEGHLDRVLLRPVPPLLQLVLENVNFNEFVVVIKGIGIMWFVNSHLQSPLGLADLARVIPLVLGGSATLAGLFLAASSLTFWFKDRTGALTPFFRLNDYCRYPLDVYPRPVRIFVTWIIPFAFAAFYPAQALLEGKGGPPLWLVPCAGFAVALAGFAVFARGLRRYESTGS